MRNIENFPNNEEDESISVERDIKKCKAFKEKGDTEEGQIRMWKQMEEYTEVVRNCKTNALLVELSSGKSHEEFQKGLEDFVKNERNIPISKRTLKEVAAAYDFTLEEFRETLEGKKVLDIGSGRSELSREAEENNINTDIVSLDVSRDALAESGTYSGVAAMGEKMPFSDEKYDLVTAIYSIPYWANSAKSAEDFMRESLRVAKKGGEIYITPITDILNRPSIKKDNSSLKGVLAKNYARPDLDKVRLGELIDLMS
ncbi:MAG: class I SAM-dependent methyltransferase, partial [Minisyncoccia bacterium]